MTTSYGSEELKKGDFVFGADDAGKENRAPVKEKLKEKFSAELINRLDGICFFNELTADNLSRIAELEMKALNARLAKYATRIETDEQAMNHLLKNLQEKNLNARDIRQKVRAEIEQAMAQIILSGKIKKTYQLFSNANGLALK